MTKTETRTLVFCDDAWHPAAVVRRGLGALSDLGFQFEFLEDSSRSEHGEPLNSLKWAAKKI
jgi:hypothetical protein